MIKEVSFEKTTYNDIPFKFEAGTPNIADVIAFKSSLEFFDQLGKSAIKEHEDKLLHYAVELLTPIKVYTTVGNAREKLILLS